MNSNCSVALFRFSVYTGDPRTLSKIENYGQIGKRKRIAIVSLGKISATKMSVSEFRDEMSSLMLSI